MSKKVGFLERLAQGPVLAAEGYLFELERRGYLQAGPYVPEVVLEHPEAVEQLHREFLRAGSDVMLALTYYAHRDKLKAIGREGDLEALNRQAVRLAHAVAQEGDALVAGDVSNTWVYDHRKPQETGELVRAMYREQIGWAAEEGVDLIVAETLDYFGEALIALEVSQEFDLPTVINFGSIHSTTKDGYSFAEACKILADRGADVVGLNCSRGPQTMLPLVQEIGDTLGSHPLAALPVAYRTTPQEPSFTALRDGPRGRAFPIGLDPFQTTRFDMADFAVAAQDLGVSYIGVCCGGAPHHVRAMAEALGRTPPASRYSPDLSMHPALGDAVKERD
ncbi:MAG: homocysteine S-methyltransferase family protein, partial [Anaerolineae bacterium]